MPRPGNRPATVMATIPSGRPLLGYAFDSEWLAFLIAICASLPMHDSSVCSWESIPLTALPDVKPAPLIALEDDGFWALP